MICGGQGLREGTGRAQRIPHVVWASMHGMARVPIHRGHPSVIAAALSGAAMHPLAVTGTQLSHGDNWCTIIKTYFLL